MTKLRVGVVGVGYLGRFHAEKYAAFPDVELVGIVDPDLPRIGQIADLTHSDLAARLGKTGAHLWQLANGMDDRPVVQDEGYKSIGHEITFEHDTADPELLHATLLGLSEKVAQRLRSNSARARTIAIKYREADFSTYTRRTTLNNPVNTAENIFPPALKLLKTLWRDGVLVRLIGVYASNLEIEVGGTQMSLLDAAPQKDQKLASAMDSISQRFGDQAITRAALVKKNVDSLSGYLDKIEYLNYAKTYYSEIGDASLAVLFVTEIKHLKELEKIRKSKNHEPEKPLIPDPVVPSVKTETIRKFIRSFQTKSYLSIGELWATAITLLPAREKIT